MPGDEDLVSLVERMNRLLAMNLVRDLPLREKVASLDFAGFQPKEIARVVGKTPNHVSVILHELRKKEKSEDKAVTGSEENADTIGADEGAQREAGSDGQ